MDNLLAEVAGIYQNENKLNEALKALYQQTQAYAENFGAIAGKKKK